MIITLLKVFILSWVITKMEYLQWLLDLIPNCLFKYFLVVVTGCLMCCSFWTSLIMTHNIWWACLSSYIGFWYNKKITPHEIKISFK
jgi:hypothetical protein